MLSSADLAVCARDPAIPGLPTILDASALAAALGFASLTAAYLRYKPGVSCTAAFRDPASGMLAVYAYPRDRYAEVRRRPEWADDASVLFLDAQCIAVMPARFDRHLRALRRFLDPDRRGKYLRRVIGRQASLARSDIDVLRYKPGRRLVARIDRDGTPHSVLKITGTDDFNRALIGATGAAAHGGAPLLGASSAFRALVTGWVDGETICPEALARAPDAAAVAAAGAALAKVHADPFHPAAAILPADDADALVSMAEDLVALDPGLAQRAGRIGFDVAARLAESVDATTLIHGDFSADQVVVTRDRPVIIDWDQAACGDPARDIGTFLARLDAQAVDGLLTRAQADDLGAALVEGYARAARRVPASIAPHHARALLLLATEGFRLRHQTWLQRGAALVDRAAALMSRPGRRHRDPAMPALDAALDTSRVLPELVRILASSAPSDLRIAPPEVIRHKPGRRALVRFRPQGADMPPLLGKIRAKGPDRCTPKIHKALRAAGLDGGAAGGVGVPRALGRIDALDMWLQQEVPGVTLRHYLVPSDPARAEVFARAGAALARLHDVPAVIDRPWTLADEADVLDRALDRAVRRMPDAGEALRAIQRGARARLERLGAADSCGIHRDFYFDQVQVDGPRIWLLDLDLYAVGDPAVDLGNFLAHLDEFGLRCFGDVRALDAQASAFTAGYAQIRPLPPPDRISTLRSVSLARHIHISTLFTARGHVTSKLISLTLDDLADTERAWP